MAKMSLIYFDPLWSSFHLKFEVGKDSSQVLVLGATNTPWDSMDWVTYDFVNDEIIGVDFAF